MELNTKADMERLVVELQEVVEKEKVAKRAVKQMQRTNRSGEMIDAEAELKEKQVEVRKMKDDLHEALLEDDTEYADLVSQESQSTMRKKAIIAELREMAEKEYPEKDFVKIEIRPFGEYMVMYMTKKAELTIDGKTYA